MNRVHATIALLTFNAEPYLRELLDGSFSQKTEYDYEVLVIDSGSVDDTLEIIKEYPKVRLHQIPNSEFGHGKTRNLAAELAKGEFVVYLTHDAVPAHDQWLTQMLRPFDIDKRVVCVYGKQIPRQDCCPIVKRDVITLFNSFGPDHFTMIQSSNPFITHRGALDAIGFFSDVNSAVRKSLFETIPYQDLNYSEDQAMGQDVIKAGLLKAYAPLGSVVHSHSYPLKKYFQRMYDEMVGLKSATGQSLDTGLLRHAAIVTRGTLQDWKFILRDHDYGLITKVKWILLTPFYNLARRVAIRLSTKKELPVWAHNFLSLEANLKKKTS